MNVAGDKAAPSSSAISALPTAVPAALPAASAVSAVSAAHDIPAVAVAADVIHLIYTCADGDQKGHEEFEEDKGQLYYQVSRLQVQSVL
jgi:hypothetical protein